MAVELGKLAYSIKERAGEAAKVADATASHAGAVAAQARDTIVKAAGSTHNVVDKNEPAHTEGVGKIKDAASSALEAAQAAALEAKRKVGELKGDDCNEYEIAIIAYNVAYTDMNDNGAMLHRQRERAVDVITLSEELVNSIANKPKSFDTDFEEIKLVRKSFTEAEDYAVRELADARKSAGAGGAGLAAGAAVASLAPSAAMWIATTFGTASTGAAISTLSGAAAHSAALAWLGGGAIAAGGAGTAGGSALLALAGPIGWSIAGASLLASLVLFTRKRVQTLQEKSDELKAIKNNTEQVREIDAKIGALLDQTAALRNSLNESFVKSMHLAKSDYAKLSNDEKMVLGALVNNTKSLALLLNTKIAVAADNEELVEPSKPSVCKASSR